MKDFIPYKESIAIKELGFDEPCFGFYDDNNKPVGGNYPCDGINSAPLYQQVFDWFDEKGLFSNIVRGSHGTEWQGGRSYEFNISGSSGSFGFQSKKLAEQGCIRSLISALKMDENYMKKLNRDKQLNELGI